MWRRGPNEEREGARTMEGSWVGAGTVQSRGTRACRVCVIGHPHRAAREREREAEERTAEHRSQPSPPVEPISLDQNRPKRVPRRDRLSPFATQSLAIPYTDRYGGGPLPVTSESYLC